MGELERLTEQLAGLPPEELRELSEQVMADTSVWAPNIGPQTEAYFCEADELFYGGQAGGGKTDLIVGSALTAHKQSLVLRRFASDVMGVAERAMEILGTREGFNGQSLRLRLARNHAIDFGGCKEEMDKERYKGRPHDLIAFDEVADFLESQYRFIIGWNRSVDPNQRCRVICAGNPPTTPEGLWVIKHWGPWLNPHHPKYPTPDGYLRWYTTIEGEDVEVESGDPIEVDGETIYPRSRTFIRARLQDNPDLYETNYDAVLAGLPEGLRLAYREGKFDLGLKDRPMQLIPTEWVRQAQERWTEEPPHGIPMCAMGVDVAQGGPDNTVIAMRHDGWYAPLIVVPGADTPDGPAVAGLIMRHRRHSAEIVIDMGGGWGGSAFDHLKANGAKPIGHKGANKGHGKSKDGQLRFANKRAEVYYKFMEALDPGQFGGSRIALPKDEELMADLCAPQYELTSQGIKITPKKDLVKAAGRSTDKGDSVVMAWSKGRTAIDSLEEWRDDQRLGIVGRTNQGSMKVNMGNRRMHLKRAGRR